MKKPSRSLWLATVLNVVVGVGAAAGQTLIVTNAPAGSTVEFVLNNSAIGSGTVGADGTVTIAGTSSSQAAAKEMDAHIYVDICGNVRRVVVVDRGIPPAPPAEGCDRNQIAGLFLVRPVSTLVVNVTPPNPTVLLRQGSFRLRPPGPSKFWNAAPAGLVLFAGGGLGKFRDAVLLACGEVSECDGAGYGGVYSAGIAYWLNRFVAVEASFLKPAEATVSGSGANFRFDTTVDARLLTIGGKAGAAAGPVRFFGQGGATYHRALTSTTQTIEDVTRTVDGVTTTIPGGTQTYELETAGWGWHMGGGIEAWVTRSFAFYGEVGRAFLKGDAVGDGEGRMDEGLTSFVFGARVRIGR